MAKYKNKGSLLWKIKRFIKNRILLDLMAIVFYILDKIHIKVENSILYFFQFGEKLSDNSIYLFNYLEKNSDYNQLLFTVDKKVYNTYKSIYHEKVVYGLSYKGLRVFLKSKNIIISTGIDKLSFYPYYLSVKTKNIIQLWHGSLFKRLGFQVKNWRKIKQRKEYQPFTSFIACSTLEKFMVASCFNMPIDNVWVTNYPRNDYVLNPTNDLTIKYPILKNKIILYAPTWREEGHKIDFFPFKDVDIMEIQSFLEKNDAYLLIRGHTEEMELIANQYNLDLNKTDRIISAHQGIFPKTEQLLPYVDILITDYSGINIDFLLLNRPIIYIPYDLETYKSYRGILYDYDDFIAGPKVFNQNDFIAELKGYIDNPTKDSDLRIKKQLQFHNNIDGKACERIKNKIDELVK